MKLKPLVYAWWLWPWASLNMPGAIARNWLPVLPACATRILKPTNLTASNMAMHFSWQGRKLSPPPFAPCRRDIARARQLET